MVICAPGGWVEFLLIIGETLDRLLLNNARNSISRKADEN